MALFENNQLLSNFGNLFKGKSVNIPTGSNLKGSPWSALFGDYGLFTNPTGAWDKFKNGNTNEVNQNIANQNLGFQRENLEYEKALQKQIFEREDTSYQRTVNDMRMAGLNPLSMQGTNGAGEAIQTEALHNDYQHTDTSNLQAVSAVMDVINQFSANQANLSQQRANTNLINAQAENQKIKNLYESDILSKQIDSMYYSTIGQKFKNERENIAWLQDQRDYLFNKQFGLSNNMPDFAKILNYSTHQGNLKENQYKIFDRDWDNFGSTFNYMKGNPSFNNLQNVLENTQLKGSLMENKIGEALLSILGIR